MTLALHPSALRPQRHMHEPYSHMHEPCSHMHEAIDLKQALPWAIVTASHVHAA